MAPGRVTAILAASLLLSGSAARAADFYQGKQVTIVVGFSAAGTYDATARLFARHLGRHLGGKPTVIAEADSQIAMVYQELARHVGARIVLQEAVSPAMPNISISDD